MTRAVFADGLVSRRLGNVAAWMPDHEEVCQLRVVELGGSTCCELVALGLMLQMDTLQVLTDSLTSLRLL